MAQLDFYYDPLPTPSEGYYIVNFGAPGRPFVSQGGDQYWCEHTLMWRYRQAGAPSGHLTIQRERKNGTKQPKEPTMKEPAKYHTTMLNGQQCLFRTRTDKVATYQIDKGYELVHDGCSDYVAQEGDEYWSTIYSKWMSGMDKCGPGFPVRRKVEPKYIVKREEWRGPYYYDEVNEDPEWKMYQCGAKLLTKKEADVVMAFYKQLGADVELVPTESL